MILTCGLHEKADILTLHPAFVALIFHGIKKWDGRKRKLRKKGKKVGVYCTGHRVSLCTSKRCLSRMLNLSATNNALLRVPGNTLKNLCQKCRRSIVQYKRDLLQIAGVVSKHTDLTVREAMTHLEVPDCFLGKVVGSLCFADPVPITRKHDVGKLTLSNATMHKQFAHLHALDQVKQFKNPVDPVDRVMPGLWQARLPTPL
jgi:hypothetical protein